MLGKFKKWKKQKKGKSTQKLKKTGKLEMEMQEINDHKFK